MPGACLIRIATYNVQDLFLCGEGAAKLPRAQRALAHMIQKVAADFWLLQEVGSLASLNLLNEQLDEPFAHTYLQPGNSNRSIHLGILSRWPVSVTSHAHCALTDDHGKALLGYVDQAAALAGQAAPLRLQRDILQVELRVAAQPLVLFGVHLKSHAQMNWQSIATADVRAAEVRVLHVLCDRYRQTQPTVPMVLLGDFNDVASSSVFAPLDDLDLTDLHAERYTAMGRRPSTYWPKRRARIDRIVLNPAAAALALPDTAEIHNGHRAQVASDHYPVSLDLEVGI